ncbi:MAG: riboflavin synthase [Deltaproteobacteria bacterium]|nr:riboflavin synthase [Deltaproteobacteria bacterium]
MFTGLVETVGTVQRITGNSPSLICIESTIPVEGVAIGDSVAINGCCLTAILKESHSIVYEAAAETLARTNLGELRIGDQVNLERALRLGDHLAGHLVSGHVDGIGFIRERNFKENTLYLGIEAPKTILPLIADQGAIAVSGVSLTVTQIRGALFWVALISHTRQVTILNNLPYGSTVNLEVDTIARYVQRLLNYNKEQSSGCLTQEFLEAKGFL